MKNSWQPSPAGSCLSAGAACDMHYAWHTHSERAMSLVVTAELLASCHNRVCSHETSHCTGCPAGNRPYASAILLGPGWWQSALVLLNVLHV